MKLSWEYGKNNPGELAGFVVNHIDQDYITHLEVVEGRARSLGSWSDDLVDIFTNEFAAFEYIEPRKKSGHYVLTVREKKELLGLASITLSKQGLGKTFHAALDDIIIHRDRRGQEIGKTLVREVEKQCERLSIRRILLVTSVKNQSAQKFFESLDYAPAAICYMKELND